MTLGLVVLGFVSSLSSANLTWDANGATASQTDGAGTWTGTDQWWDGAANATWNSSTPDNATFGNGGSGGTITMGTIFAGNVTFDNFSGTYLLNSSGNITVHGNIRLTSNAGTVDVESAIFGSANILVDGGMFILDNTSNSFSGNIVVDNGAVLSIGDAWQQNNSFPNTSNLDVRDGRVRIYFDRTNGLGAGDGEFQISGGNSGFSIKQSDRHTVRFENDSNYEVVWGSTHFNPNIFVLNHEDDSVNTWIRMDNPYDLNGVDRTIYVGDSNSSYYGEFNRVIRNSVGNSSGIIKTGAGVLRLTATCTYDGETRVNEGTFRVSQAFFNDSADIIIESGATLQLDHSGTDTINRLFIDGEQRGTIANETWGGFGSGADQEIGSITGSGILRVSTPNVGKPLIRLD